MHGKTEIRQEQVLLLHKMEKVNPGTGIRFELGGTIAAQELKDAVAGELVIDAAIGLLLLLHVVAC